MTKLVNRMIENEVNLLIERRRIGKKGNHNGGLAVASGGDKNQA